VTVKEAATQEAWSATPGEGCLRPAQKALVKEVAEKAGESVAQFVHSAAALERCKRLAKK
jgi:hypothetical protein